MVVWAQTIFIIPAQPLTPHLWPIEWYLFKTLNKHVHQLMLWLRTQCLSGHRLGHASEKLIRSMAKSGRIPSHRIDLSHRLPFCESCATTNMTARGPISTTAREPDSPSLPSRMLQELSVDVAGPYPKDKKGNWYFVLFVDRFTRFKYIGLMKKKSDTYDHFMSFVSQRLGRIIPTCQLTMLCLLDWMGEHKEGSSLVYVISLPLMALESYPLVVAIRTVTHLQRSA